MNTLPNNSSNGATILPRAIPKVRDMQSPPEYYIKEPITIPNSDDMQLLRSMERFELITRQIRLQYANRVDSDIQQLIRRVNEEIAEKRPLWMVALAQDTPLYAPLTAALQQMNLGENVLNFPGSGANTWLAIVQSVQEARAQVGVVLLDEYWPLLCLRPQPVNKPKFPSIQFGPYAVDIYQSSDEVLISGKETNEDEYGTAISELMLWIILNVNSQMIRQCVSQGDIVQDNLPPWFDPSGRNILGDFT